MVFYDSITCSACEVHLQHTQYFHRTILKTDENNKVLLLISWKRCSLEQIEGKETGIYPCRGGMRILNNVFNNGFSARQMDINFTIPIPFPEAKSLFALIRHQN